MFLSSSTFQKASLWLTLPSMKDETEAPSFMVYVLLGLWHAYPVCPHSVPSHQHLPASAHCLVFLRSAQLLSEPDSFPGPPCAAVLWCNLLVLASWSLGQTLTREGWHSCCTFKLRDSSSHPGSSLEFQFVLLFLFSSSHIKS